MDGIGNPNELIRLLRSRIPYVPERNQGPLKNQKFGILVLGEEDIRCSIEGFGNSGKR